MSFQAFSQFLKVKPFLSALARVVDVSDNLLPVACCMIHFSLDIDYPVFHGNGEISGKTIFYFQLAATFPNVCKDILYSIFCTTGYL